MGHLCQAHGAIGILVDIKQLTRSVKEKRFDHSYPENFEYDPVTGKHLWTTYTGFNLDLFPHRKSTDEFDTYKEQIGGYYLTEVDDETCCIYIKNLYVSEDYTLSSADMITEEEFLKFKETMEKLGLWSNNYGFHIWL